MKDLTCDEDKAKRFCDLCESAKCDIVAAVAAFQSAVMRSVLEVQKMRTTDDDSCGRGTLGERGRREVSGKEEDDVRAHAPKKARIRPSLRKLNKAASHRARAAWQKRTCWARRPYVERRA